MQSVKWDAFSRVYTPLSYSSWFARIFIFSRDEASYDRGWICFPVSTTARCQLSQDVNCPLPHSTPQLFPQRTHCNQLLKTQNELHVGMDPPTCFRLTSITCLPQAFTLPSIPRAIFISLTQHKISPFLRG